MQTLTQLVELLVAVHLLWGNPGNSAFPATWEFVSSRGEAVVLTEVGAQELRVAIRAPEPDRRPSRYRFLRQGDRLEIEHVMEDSPGGPRSGSMPGRTVVTASARSPGVRVELSHLSLIVSVARSAPSTSLTLGGRPWSGVSVDLLRVDSTWRDAGPEPPRPYWCRLITRAGVGVVGLEALAVPDGAEPGDELLTQAEPRCKGWLYRVDPSQSCGPQATLHPLLDLALDTADGASLPWRGGPRGIDPAALDAAGRAAPDLEARAQEILRRVPDDLLLHLETLRRLALYLSTVGGTPLTPDERALDRMRDAARDFGMATLYGKVAMGPRAAFYFDLGAMLEAFHECGLRDDWDPLPFLQQAARSEPENPTVYVGLALAYEAKGLPDRAAEYRHWALRLGAPPAPIHDRLERALRGSRDAASWSQYGKYLEDCAARARPPMRVRVTTRDGRVLAGDLLDFGSRTYRVRVGDEVVAVEETDVRKIVFGE